jgi:hypothetical protein
MVDSRGVITDAGAVVEETCVLQAPSVQMRRSTERPRVYYAGPNVKFDPAEPDKCPAEIVFPNPALLYGKTWPYDVSGDRNSLPRIAEDLHRRIVEDELTRHRPDLNHVPVGAFLSR